MGLFLSRNEAGRLIDELEVLILQKEEYKIKFYGDSKGNGAVKKKMKVVVYDKESVERLDDTTRKLIKTGEL